MKLTGILNLAITGVATLFAAQALATPPVEIEVVEATRDCYEDEFSVAFLPDGYGRDMFALEGMFSDMAALADSMTRTSKRSCQVRYNLHVPQGYKISNMNFSAAGTYSVAPGGNVRATIAHKVGNQINRRATIQRRGSHGIESGELSDLVRDETFANPIYGADLAPNFRGCGASIPVRTQLVIHATQSGNVGGHDSFSEVYLDSIEGSASARQGRTKQKKFFFCKVEIIPCH